MNPSLTSDAAGSSERAYQSRQGNQAEGEGAAAWQPFAELWQGPLGGRMACYTVGEDLPAEFQDDEFIEHAETSRDHGEKNAGTITGKLRTKANHRQADAEQDGFPGPGTSAPGSARLESRASVSIRWQSALHPRGCSPQPSCGWIAAAVLGVEVGRRARISWARTDETPWGANG